MMYKRNEKKILIYILSFIIPVIMMLAASICLQLFPFGENTLLVSDINNQFVSFYSYFKSIITSDNNFIYTFSKNLGGDMVGFSGYYLQNPFLFLLLLFPDAYLPAGILLIITLQVGFCGLTFQLYLNHTNKFNKEALLFSTAYAFMGYLFAYITLPIYFCNIILLPLVMLGISKLIENPKKKGLYISCLAASILCNYYLGYMLCFFSLFYFIYLIIVKTDIWRHTKEPFEKIKAFTIASLLGVGLSAFDLIPIIFSLSGQKNAPESSALTFYRNFNFIEMFSKLYTGAFDGNVSNHGMPYIYVGMIAVIFVILYFFNNEISGKERICSGIFLVVLLLCCYVHTIDVILHAFNEPVGFPYRYAFFICFLLLHLGYQGFLKHEGMWTSYVPVVLTFFLYSLYLILFSSVDIKKEMLLFDSVILILIGILAFIKANYYLPLQLGLVILLGLQCTDLLSNAICSVKQYDSVLQEEYDAYIDRVAPVIGRIEENDTSFYRIEKNFQRNLNDAMQFSYNGLSHNSSCEKDYVKEFVACMGFRNFGIWAFYNEGSTSFVDCFLGVKYFISKYDTTNKPYLADFHTEDTYVFENPYALPLAFGMREQVKDVRMDQEDLFKIQNDIVKSFGSDTPIYTKAKVTKTILENLTEEAAQDGSGEYTVYKKSDGDEEAFIEYEITASGSNNLYLYFAAPKMQGSEIFVNDFSYGDYFSNWRWNIVNAGVYEKGDKINIRLNVQGDELALYDSYFYEEQESALSDWYQIAGAEAGNLTKRNSSHLEGTILLKESKYLVFSIPYEKDWVIHIDGERVEQEEVLDALMAVKLSEGSHTIDLYYLPKGFLPGLCISILSILIFGGMQAYYYVRKR